MGPNPAFPAARNAAFRRPARRRGRRVDAVARAGAVCYDGEGRPRGRAGTQGTGMTQIDSHLSTGLGGLDRVLKGLIPGDNLVWHVESLEDYQPFLKPYCDAGRRLEYACVYFRFAKHPPLLTEADGVQVVPLKPEAGFEAFLSEIHKVVEHHQHRAFYVFDCLSDLAADWYSDQMLANFFMLTCPYVYDVHALAYFAILRQTHSFHTTSAIADTAQVLLDVYRHRERLYVHPWKVQARHSPKMHMLHLWEGEEFRPVTESATISEILTPTPWLREGSAASAKGLWDRTFLRAEQVLGELKRGEADPKDAEALEHRLMRMAVSRDERVVALAEQYLTLEDLLRIGERMVGTGLIGGKAVGMLLARAILRRRAPQRAARLEAHDSFYVGSDVFYSYIVRNGLWWTRAKQRDPDSFLEGAEQARQRMLTGTFPDYISRRFEDMLDYFGQSPIIVRSSSLLEDNFGNAFAGKYDSVFCVNQGPRHQRLEDFLAAVRTIYASSMSHRALTYRAQRGLLDRDEQMALLVQRVSGAMYGDTLYYPEVAGVGFSFNPYVWSEQIDPKAGVLRLVFGLGTRAVDRSDDDYTRLVALNAPDRRPDAQDKIRRYSQRKVDVLDLEGNQLVSESFPRVVQRSAGLPVEMFASVDPEEARREAERGRAAAPHVLTFEKLFTETEFVEDMREMLSTLQEAYQYPVDVEFTTNFLDDRGYRINVVQCRPLQVREGGVVAAPPEDLPEERRVLSARGALIGRSRVDPVHRIVYIVPTAYGKLPVPDRYTVARLIGRLTRAPVPVEGEGEPGIMLIGPGRWGTTTPSLGVPVQFADVSGVSVMCEVVAMRENLTPDVSLGTHFFSDLVELDILYFALFPDREGNNLNEGLLTAAPNRLTELLPDLSEKDARRWTEVIRVIDAPDLAPVAGDGAGVTINANVLSQRIVCYIDAAGR